MIGKSAWLALGVLAFVGCGDAGVSNPPSSDVASSPTTGASVVPPTDASKGEAPASTGGMSASGPADVSNRDADGAKSPGEAPDEKAIAAAPLTAEEIAQVKTLPAEDQDAAMAQKLCPISGHHLGSMDTPIKVTAEGKTAYLCCEGCKKLFEKDPKTALAKIGK